jgi:hypothetical protein
MAMDRIINKLNASLPRKRRGSGGGRDRRGGGQGVEKGRIPPLPFLVLSDTFMRMLSENKFKVDAFLKKLKSDTGDEWFAIGGFFSLTPYQGYSTLGSVAGDSAMASTYIDVYSHINPYRTNRYTNPGTVLVKLFVNTKTSEVRTVLAQSLI